MSIAAGTYGIRSHAGVLDVARLASGPIEPDLPDPFGIALRVREDEIDAFGHVNNTVYQRWMEACAWAHSAAVGLDPDRCRALQRGMALKAIETDYLRASFRDQTIVVLNWIAWIDRLKAERRFQVCCAQTGSTLARSRASYVCIDLATGAPSRMPPDFIARYTVSEAVRARLSEGDILPR